MLPEGFVRRHLGGRGIRSVVNAVAIGVPMPLCSCGVIPTAIGLRKDGASKGAATGFLISTPQTGVDSILVSGTFLGWPFAIFKVAAALVSGLVGGLVVNAADGEEAEAAGAVGKTSDTCEHHGSEKAACCEGEPKPPSCCKAEQAKASCCATGAATKRRGRLVEALRYGMVELLGDVYRWVIVGVLVAAGISAFVPAGRLSELGWTQGLAGMVVMLVVSMPMYICATASVPLAASLVVAGMEPGAALVLLMAGPTTNVATMGAILRALGGRVLGIYVTTVAVMSVGLGWAFNWLLAGDRAKMGHVHPLPDWVGGGAAVVLVGLMGWLAAREVRGWLGRRG